MQSAIYIYCCNVYNTIIDNTYTNLVRFSYPKAMQLTLPNTMNKNKTFLNFLITVFWVKHIQKLKLFL